MPHLHHIRSERNARHVAPSPRLVGAAACSLSGCSYNEFQRLDEQVKAAWSEVLNQYQRRADLIPNIVAPYREASFEQETLTKVVEARARATDQRHARARQQPRGVRQVPAGAGRAERGVVGLMVVAEQYPQLKANAAFQDLRRSWKAPRTASPSLQPLHQRRWTSTTCRAQLPDVT